MAGILHRSVVVQRNLLEHGALDIFHTMLHQAGLNLGAPLVCGCDERLGAEAECPLEHIQPLSEQFLVVSYILV